MSQPTEPPDLATLLADLEALPDAALREKARAAVSAVLALHADGLARALTIVKQSEAGPPLLDALANDRAVSALLFLHDLHPTPLAERLARATDRTRGRLASYGVTLEATEMEGRAVRLRLARGQVPDRARDEAESIAIETFAEHVPELEPTCEWQEASGLLPAHKLVRAVTAPQGGSSIAKSSGRASDHAACELCAKPIGPVHDHLLGEDGRDLRCACPACALLFDGDARTKWRRVRRKADRVALGWTEASWAELGLPVRMAFFVRRPAAAFAVYPSPAGATEMAIEPSAWQSIVARHPLLDGLAVDTEAVLVNHAGNARHEHRVSIDIAYELVGVLRRDWRGLGGGTDVWQAVDRFFRELEVGGATGAAHA